MVDVIAWVVSWLTAAIPGVEVAGDSTAREQGEEWVDVRSAPGGREIVKGRMWTTPAVIRCYGATADARRALCLSVLDTLRSAPGAMNDDLVVTRVDVTSTAYSDIDMFTGEHLTSCQVEIYCRTR